MENDSQPNLSAPANDFGRPPIIENTAAHSRQNPLVMIGVAASAVFILGFFTPWGGFMLFVSLPVLALICMYELYIWIKNYRKRNTSNSYLASNATMVSPGTSNKKFAPVTARQILVDLFIVVGLIMATASIVVVGFIVWIIFKHI